MGLNLRSLELLRQWVADGNELGDVLTLGHLQLVPMRFESDADFRSFFGGGWPPGEPLTGDAALRTLGATSVHSLDRSDYEGASIVHDLNEPLSPEFHERYHTVIDGGTLEHVFNFSTGLASCMSAVEKGGCLINILPMNNQPCHGFFQVTPELMYRALSPQNGFVVEKMFAYERFPGGRIYEVDDPAQLGRRLRLVGGHAMDLVTMSRRVDVVPIFAKPPEQSDYAVRWDKSEEEDSKKDVRGVRAASLRTRTANWMLSRLGDLSPSAGRVTARMIDRIQRQAPIGFTPVDD